MHSKSNCSDSNTKKLIRLITVSLTLICFSKLDSLQAQKTSIDRQDLITLTNLAEKTQYVEGENKALRIKVSNLEDTLASQKSVYEKKLTEKEMRITQLEEEVESYNSFKGWLKKVGWFAGAILALFLFLKFKKVLL